MKKPSRSRDGFLRVSMTINHRLSVQDLANMATEIVKSGCWRKETWSNVEYLVALRKEGKRISKKVLETCLRDTLSASGTNWAYRVWDTQTEVEEQAGLEIAERLFPEMK